MPTIDQCEIPGRKGQIILQKEPKSRNHALREWWNVLNCAYAQNNTDVANSTLTLNHCKHYGRGGNGLNRPNAKTNAANETNKGPTDGSGTPTTVSTHTPGAADTDPSPTIPDD
jgi:hypothetical protein